MFACDLQNTGLDKPPTVPPKATSPKPSFGSGSKSRGSSSFEELPVQDPPWLKQKKDSKPSLPVQDPPWLEQKKSSKEGQRDKPYPIPTETAPNRQSECRFDKPYPLPTETAPYQPSDRKQFPLPSELHPARGKGKKWQEDKEDSPPPLPPGRTTSKRDVFEPERVPPPTSSRKPIPPPTPKKPVREEVDDFDFPTAEQLRSKGNRASQPFAQPPIPQRSSSDSRWGGTLDNRSSRSSSDSRWGGSIDNRPPIAPPKPSYREFRH